MGRGPSEIVTDVFVKEQIQRMDQFLSRYMEGSDFNHCFYESIPRETVPPSLVAHFSYVNQMLCQLIRNNRNTDYDRTVQDRNLFDSHLDARKWIDDKRSLDLTEQELEAMEVIMELADKLGTGRDSCTIAHSVTLNDMKNKKCQSILYFEKSTTEIGIQYRYIVSELKARYQPDTDFLRTIFRYDRTSRNRKNQIHFSFLDSIGQQVLNAKLTKLAVYKEFSDVGVQVEQSIQNITNTLEAQAPLRSLEENWTPAKTTSNQEANSLLSLD